MSQNFCISSMCNILIPGLLSVYSMEKKSLGNKIQHRSVKKKKVFLKKEKGYKNYFLNFKRIYTPC